MEPVNLCIASLSVVTAWQLYYYLRYFLRLAHCKASNKSSIQTVPVSVVIVARNEYPNLEANLSSWLEQDHPDFEVIVVNNGSWDRSQEFLEAMEEQYPRLRVINIVEQERYPKGKKFGLTLGIKAAKNEWLLLTDSDCRPDSRSWISSMSHSFVAGKEIVLGYSPYEKRKSFLNYLIRFDTFYTAMQYLGFALGSKPYMGVGRNLAYQKSLFFKVKGFASHNHIMAGDDDLFVNETATASNCAVNINPESFVRSMPKSSFEEWIKQKKRHLSVGKYYAAKDRLRLAGLHSSNTLFYLTLAISLFFCLPLYPNPMALVPVWIFSLRLVTQYLIYGFAMRRLKETDLLYLLPILDLYFLFFYPIMGLSAQLTRSRKNKW